MDIPTDLFITSTSKCVHTVSCTVSIMSLKFMGFDWWLYLLCMASVFAFRNVLFGCGFLYFCFCFSFAAF